MRIRTIFVTLAFFAAASALAAPQATAPRDPQVIDAQGYQKLVEQYRGKAVLITKPLGRDAGRPSP